MLTNRPRPRARRLDLAPGDPVVVVAGKDKGKHGEVLRTLPDQGKIVVKGVNILRRHAKSGQSVAGNKNYQGGIVDFEAPFDYSNVMLVCPSCSKPTRIRHAALEDGRRVIECTHCGEPYERIKHVETQ
jgi:large subunit ribosomal protein L24